MASPTSRRPCNDPPQRGREGYYGQTVPAKMPLAEFENRPAPAIAQPSSSGMVSMTMRPCSQQPKKLSGIWVIGSCPEPLQILKGFGQIDLLFSDIVMTGKINGIQLAAHRREQLAANLREFIDRKAAEKLPYWDVLQKTRKGE